MRRCALASILFLCSSVLLTAPLGAATLRSVVPAQAPHGARVVVIGNGLDDPQLAVTFTAATSTSGTASIVSRTATEIELRVPETAISGPLHVGNDALPFTITPDPGFVQVATLIASDASHDLVKQPSGTAVDSRTGTVFVADTMHHRIVSITPAGALAVIAGTGKPGYADGAASIAQFSEPNAVTLDQVRNVLYVADSGNHVIRRVTPDGSVSTLAGSGRPGFADGSAAQASFSHPSSIALDATGNLIVADTGNHAVRLVTPQGVVSTLAGGLHDGYADGPVGQALFSRPQGVAVSSMGTVYIADTGNHRLRAISGSIVSTIAGTGHPSLTDGSGPTAEFKEPAAIVVDSTGSLLIADRGNDAVRLLVFGSSGTTVATIATQAAWKMPSGITSEGAVFAGDSGTDAVRVIYRSLAASAIYPRVGPPAGGNVIRLFGTGFVPGATTVTFGTTSVQIAYVTSTELLVTVPSGLPGTVDVRVETPAGSATLTGAYTYLPPPTIISVAPRKGSTAGGQTLTISGANFIDGDTQVTIGGVNAAVTNVSSSALTLTTPPGNAGPADVIVSTSAGSDRAIGAFTYFAPPVITNFSPNSGRSGTSINIAGANFDPDASGDQVTINGAGAPIISASATSLVVTIPSDATTGPIRITTAGGTAQSGTSFNVVNFTSFAITPRSLALIPGDHQQLSASATLFGGGAVDVTAQANWTSSNPAVATVDHGLVVAVAEGQATITASFSGFSATAAVAVTTVRLPPDPATIAPPPNLTQVTPFASSYAFLYSGPNAIQTGVAANTIDTQRAAVIRGVVRSRDGSPLPAVHVTIAGHPELGQTLSRADGAFDLAVNGGGPLTVHYERSGYLSADRLVQTVWQDFVLVDDVALVTLDPKSTTITTGAAAPQVAQGTTSTDERGSRTATLMFPAGVTASMTLANGSSAPLTTLTVRATEYTVGPNGPAAMPASLPPSSYYTYCVEFSVDEAIAAGATTVAFNKPVSVYVDNFIGFPAGADVPAGFYDRTKNRWQPINNGRVIKLLSITNGIAALDTDGDGNPDSTTKLAALGIDAAELQTLATLYPAGQTFWRVQVLHFSPHDLNWPAAPPLNAKAAKTRPRRRNPAVNDPSKCGGSIIDCQNQILGEAFGLAGTGIGLRYSSADQRGRRDQYQLDITVTDNDPLPDSMTGAVVRISIAGQQTKQSFPATPGQHFLYEWNGRDAYGLTVEGPRTASVDIDYEFKAAYYTDAALRTQAFAMWTGTGSVIAPIGGTAKFVVTTHFETWLGTVDPKSTIGLGGWTLSAHHVYDPARRILHLGTGDSRIADPSGSVMNTAAGNGSCCTTVEGALATATALDHPTSVAVAADGSFYIATANRMFVVDRSGTIRLLAGTGQSGFSADGTVATNAAIAPSALAVGPDGSLVFVDGGTRVRRISGGVLTTIAGKGQSGLSIEGPALQSPLSVNALAFGPDGTLYMAEGTPLSVGYVAQVDSNGLLSIIAGLGQMRPTAGGVSALDASLGFLGRNSLAAGPDGSVYVMNGDAIVYRISSDGIVRPFAGSIFSFLPDRDGVAATSVSLAPANPGIDVAHDGTVYFTTGSKARIRAVRPDGIITTVAGGGSATSVLAPDGVSAYGTSLNIPFDLRIAPDGSLLLPGFIANAVKRVVPLPPYLPAGSSEIVIASQSGGLAYVFDATGRHLRTVDTNTGITLLQFGYETHGYLSSITDRDGQTLSIERDADGSPAAIVAPGGQRTKLTLDAQGYLASVTDPGGEVTQVTHSDGLLTSLTTPRGFNHAFTFDTAGRLVLDQDPAGGSTTLLRSGNDEQFTVTRTTAEGRVTRFDVDRSSTTATARTSTAANGLSMRAVIGNDQTITSTTADNMTITGLRMSDPRFGMQAPTMQTATVKTPSGLALTITRGHAVSLADPKNPLSLVSRIDTTSFNGSTFSSTFNAATRQAVIQSPLGRTMSRSLNPQGRIANISVPGITASSYSYDSTGRPTLITQGSRSVGYTWDSANHLKNVRDSLGRTVGFDYDANGHVTRKTLFDGRQIAFTRDADGNITSITPPGRPAHLFTFTSIDRGDSYTIPGGASTQVHYNRDHHVTSLIRPDGAQITNGYDSAGRLSTIAAPSGLFTMSYSSTAGTLTSITAPSGAVASYTYDGFLPKTITFSGPVNGVLTFAFDQNFRLTSKRIGSAAPINYTYDGDGLLSSAGIETIARDAANGRVTGTTAGLINDTVSYDEFGQVSTYTALLNGSPMFAEHYTRDAAGRITAIDETIGDSTTARAFGYDDAGRLASVKKDGVSVATYTFDVNSNRLTHVTNAGTESGTYDDQDRVTSYNGFTFNYTPNGEIASKTSSNGTTAYRYDSFGNLIGVTLPNGHVIDYILDARSRRIAKKVDGVITQKFLYSDGVRPIAQLAADDSVVYQFLYAERANVPSLIIGSGGTYRVIADHLGSPRGIIDVATGASLEYLAYDEFGNITTDTAPGFQPFGFAGGLYDADTHLAHFGAREYDPTLGRFITRDPIGFAGGQSNVYDYAANDPVNFSDPTGLMIGDQAGADAQRYYVDHLTDPNASVGTKVLAGIGAALTSLWTPCTSDATFNVLFMAATLGAGAPAAAEEEAFEYWIRQVETLDFSTPENGAVFYSGPGNRALAEEFAAANGRTTLEMTPGGQWLDQQQLFDAASGLSKEEAYGVWARASQRYAMEASGNAVGFAEGANPLGIFNTVEYPALSSNPNVVNVITGGF